VEVQQEAYVVAADAHVGQQLRTMGCPYLLHGFDLDDDGILDNKVEAVMTAEVNVLVSRWQLHLTRESDAAQAEFMDQRALV
jgi:hypothetical protein